MQTQLIQGTQLGERDAEIMRIIEKQTDPHGGGSIGMRIAIRNSSGEIYRTITTQGLGEFMGVTQAILSAGYTDELGAAQFPVDGHDAIMRPDR